MPERKFRLPWIDLEHLLQKVELILPGEEIREITLVKPKELLIYIERR